MFEIHKNSTQYWWRLKASNGEILCHSEMYASKQGAQTGIAAVKAVAPGASTKDCTV